MYGKPTMTGGMQIEKINNKFQSSFKAVMKRLSNHFKQKQNHHTNAANRDAMDLQHSFDLI